MPNLNDSAGRQAAQMNIRLPHDLRERIRASAKTDLRSFGSQVVFLLERALPAEKRTAEKVDTSEELGA